MGALRWSGVEGGLGLRGDLEADLGVSRGVFFCMEKFFESVCPAILLGGQVSSAHHFVSSLTDTRSSVDLKKAIESLEAEKKAMAEKMKAMEDQIFELSVNRRGEDENVQTAGTGVRTLPGAPLHMDLAQILKVDIPEYDGKTRRILSSLGGKVRGNSRKCLLFQRKID
ncbi:hypothetical protein Tco_0045292 [Tanacetum coccineum]